MSEKEDVTLNDDNICNEIIHGARDVVPITCDYKNRNPPLRGQHVTIRRKENAQYKYLLKLCEVEVLSCPPGRWGYSSSNPGDDCSQVCDTCRDVPETCRVSDGYCFTGCQDGFWGDGCDNECDCEACNRTTGCPVVGESKRKGQMFFFQILYFRAECRTDTAICDVRKAENIPMNQIQMQLFQTLYFYAR